MQQSRDFILIGVYRKGFGRNAQLARFFVLDIKDIQIQNIVGQTVLLAADNHDLHPAPVARKQAEAELLAEQPAAGRLIQKARNGAIDN